MDYTEDKTDEKEESMLYQQAKSYVQHLIVEIVKHVLNYTEEDISRLEPLRPQQT